MKLSRPARRILVCSALVLLALVAVRLLFFPSGKVLPLSGIVTTDSVIVAPESAGRLERLLVREGDAVKAGQLLGTIQSAEPRADLSYYEHTEQQASAQVSRAEADLKYQEALTESQIKQAEAGAAAAGAQVAAAAADAENTRLNFRRAEELRRSGTASVQDYDAARTANVSAEARLEAARKQAAAAQAAIELARANQNQVAASRAALRGQTDVLAASGAQKDKAAVRLAYTELHAPIDGIVDVRAARAGEVVGVGQPVVTLVNPDDLWVRVDVEESYIDGVHLGDRMTVRLPSGAEREGTVFYRAVDGDYATQRDVSRTKRDVKTFEIRLRCDNRDRALALGMTAYVSLPLGRR